MSYATSHKLKSHFQQELNYLRERAVEFSQDYPAVAQELALSRGKSGDPQIEMLLQSFAFLTSRLKNLMEAGEARIPNYLLSHLYPHLEAPTPSMAVVQANVQSSGANFSNIQRLDRGRILYAEATDSMGNTEKCRFRTCYDTELWPLKIETIQTTPTNRFDFLTGHSDVRSVLRIKIVATGHDAIQSFPLTSLRFFIDGNESGTYKLYDLLSSHVTKIIVLGQNGNENAILGAENLIPLGFEDDEAMLPSNNAGHSAYRLLQEYFSFPEKYLFFDIDGLSPVGSTDSMELLLLLDDVPDKDLILSNDSLKLNCAPAINLFSQSIDPIALDHTQYEYRVTANQNRHRYTEIYSIESLLAIKPDEKPRQLLPFYEMSDQVLSNSDEYFWSARRSESPIKSEVGTELHLSFMDTEFDVMLPPDEAISGQALCTNRKLPEQMRVGDVLSLEGPGPVPQFDLVTKPSRHVSPQLMGSHPWRLVSLLSPNHLSLSSDPKSLTTLKSLLMLHADNADPCNLKQVEGISEMICEQSTLRLGADAWRGFCRGTNIKLLVDETTFEDGSPLLLGAVLRHFFALYTNVNAFTRLILESKQRKGIWKKWMPLAGDQTAL